MNFLDKMERKYGRYALSHLTMYIIVTYIAGYIIALAAPIMRQYLTLEPYYILHGQIWRLDELLELLGLSDRKNHLPNQLSGGQQQRVSIGRALMNAPAVMLADEPTGSLDSRNGQEIVRLLKLSNIKYGQTLILVTHDENIALQADRIIGISDGRVVRDERVRP